MKKSAAERTEHYRKKFNGVGGLYEHYRFLQSLGTLYESWIEIETVLSNLKRLKNDHHNRVLHIGIGSARIAKEIACHGHKVVGIDIAPEMLRHSAEVLHRMGHKQECDFVLSSMDYLPFKENCFDATICIRALKYASYPSKVLLEAHRVLKQRGIFIVEFPNIKTYHSFLIPLQKLIGKKLRVKYFSLDEIIKNARIIRFNILNVEETLRLPRFFYTKVNQKRFLKATIALEKALSWLLPKNILTRSFIMTCARTQHSS